MVAVAVVADWSSCTRSRSSTKSTSSSVHGFSLASSIAVVTRKKSPRPFVSSSSSSSSSSTALFHMGGHSHEHHHHDETKQLSPPQIRQQRRRRVALWVFAWMATCGSKLVIKRQLKLSQLDWIMFVCSGLLLSSATKVRRMARESLQKWALLKEGIVKHSSSSTSTTTSTLTMAMADTTEADKVTWIGVAVNLLLSVGKLFVGVTAHSSALIADAGHSLSDLMSDFITLWSVQIARLPPDDDHPYGHYKFEAIGSLFLSLTLLATGVSVASLANGQLKAVLKNGAGAGAGAGASATTAIVAPGPLALVMAAISILSKEWLYRITHKVGQKLQSPVVLANAWHHRSDAYSSVLALISIVMARAGWIAADAAAGLLVAGMIGMTGMEILMESVQQLVDSSNEPLQQHLKQAVDQYISMDEDIQQATSLRARQVGSSAFIDVIVETPPALTSSATRAVEERLKRYLKHNLKNAKFLTATVHAKPQLVVCPLLENQAAAQNQQATSSKTSTAVVTTTTTSAAQLEFLVRQQALLLYPKITQLSGVTVHYNAAQQVSVDVQILVNSTNDLSEIHNIAKELRTHLIHLDEISQANLYLDLNVQNNDADADADADATVDTTNILAT